MRSAHFMSRAAVVVAVVAIGVVGTVSIPLRLEAQEKLALVKPTNLGQASRISGVSPADIAILSVWVARR